MENAEIKRLNELYNLNVLDTGKEARFDRFTNLIADIFDVPVVLVTLIDVNRQWFKSCVGLNIEETPRSISFCAYAIYEQDILVIFDTLKDERFVNNPVVVNKPNVRFYAGAVLRGPTGQPLGTVCIIDLKPREFTAKQQHQLIQFAQLIEHELSFTYHLNEMRYKVENALYYDVLSGIPNRRSLKERLAQLLQNNSQQPFAVISLKINQLKKIENALGSKVLEAIIAEAHKRICSVLSKTAVISRWEDDLFLIVVSVNSPEKELFKKIKKIVSVFTKPFDVQEEKQTLFCNLGISIYPDDADKADLLVNNALYAMRLELIESRTTYHFYSDESTQRLAKNYTLEKALIKAIENNTLELYYQPKVEIRTGKICGAEALCRWHDRVDGPVLPAQFIPLAEESDLIGLLGSWVLRQACQQNQQWHAEGCLKFPISVNVSQKQLQDDGFVKLIADTLQITKLPAHYLDLEITESSLIKLDEVKTTLDTIRELNASFSLDDFGTGFSSLAYLQQLPLKALKIDKRFIDNIATNPKDKLMVRTIIGLAKSLDLVCVAEGVETSEQLCILQQLECDQIQGYLFSKPLPAAEFKKLIAQRKSFL